VKVQARTTGNNKKGKKKSKLKNRKKAKAVEESQAELWGFLTLRDAPSKYSVDWIELIAVKSPLERTILSPIYRSKEIERPKKEIYARFG
jgi:hypothetical protein